MSDKQKFKILIVDDERANILSLAQILKPTYDVIVAIDGKSALEAAEKHTPDLILLDVIMPDMDGFEVLVTLKSSDLTRSIPVIFITGLASTEDEEKGFFLGAVDYITKPFKGSIVKARVKTHLQMLGYIRAIEQMGMLDPLTELPNRRGFNSRLQAEWGRAVSEKTPISVLMVDIDKFKDYNDTYGHPQGDILLQAFAEVLMNTLMRKTDYAARWGGEEFIVLLPNTDLNGALTVAESVRANTEANIVPCLDGANTFVTVSVGVCTKCPTVFDSVVDFISEADKALYAAKRSGRNRVCSSNNL